MEPLRDSWGREIKSVRVSVTDKCNFRCTYCMPAEGLEWLGRQEILSFEEISRLVGVLARLGVDEVRLTGGEPLVRRDALDAVLRGLDEVERYPELRPIKINCVAVKGFTETEVPALAELARRKPYVVRFIEFMPLDADEAWREDDVLTGAEIRAIIEAEHGPLVELTAKPSSTARRFRFADGKGELGFVNPVSEPFCSSCDRIRLTADGQLRTCLFSRREWDLKAALRDGRTDSQIADFLRFAVRHKELKHRVNEPGFVRASRSMSQIGG